MGVVEFRHGVNAMLATRKFIQRVRLTLGGAIVIYAFLVLRLPSSAIPNPVLLRTLTGLAVSTIILIFVMRRIQVFPAEALLRIQPEDAKALVRLRQGYIVTYALNLSIAVYGLMLHFLGFSISQIAPFFIGGFVPLVFFGPKVTGQSEFPPQSGQ